LWQKKISAWRPDTLARLWPDKKKESLAVRADKVGHKRPVKKKLLRELSKLTRQRPDRSLRAWRCWAAASGHPKKNLRALQSGSDRSKRKRFCAPCRVDATGQKKKILRALQKNCIWQTCAVLTSQRPVQPVFNAGSTGFDQDGPGKNWLKTAELKFSSEVQLTSSSWTWKFSWPSQLSFKRKDLKNLSTKIHSNFNIST
jgi:hypothetical protein